MALRVDSTRNKGRGVFATTPFHRGELIERAPVCVIPEKFWRHIENTVLKDYCFVWGDEMAVPFGHFMLYNHSYSPNAYYVKKLNDRILEMIALRDIEAGEEIVMNYNGDPEDDTPVWFEVRD